jgi:hypothetical protein
MVKVWHSVYLNPQNNEMTGKEWERVCLFEGREGTYEPFIEVGAGDNVPGKMGHGMFSGVNLNMDVL